MAVYIPIRLASITNAAAKSSARYAMHGIHVVDANDGTFYIEATDGKILCIARGPNDFRKGRISTLQAPGGARDFIVPRSDWDKAFKLGRDENAVNGHKPTVAMCSDKDGHITMATNYATMPALALDGRYPATMNVIPSQPPVARAAFDPEAMVRLLQIFVKAGVTRVEFLVWNRGAPTGLTGAIDDIKIDAMAMPLSEK